MNGKAFAVMLLMCICTGIIVFWIAGRQKGENIVLVDAVRLFDGFNMKKELEDAARKVIVSESRQVDSLRHDIELAKQIRPDQLKTLSYQYENAKAKFDKDYRQSDHDINMQVWKRLNILMDEFGKKYHFRLIVGANGTGNVLYVDKTLDLTDEAIQFVNKKYAGSN
jgi:outer membrane protein